MVTFEICNSLSLYRMILHHLLLYFSLSLLFLEFNELPDLVLRKMQAIIDQDHGSRHEGDSHIGQEMPEHLSEEPKQGVIFGEGQDPEEENEGEGLTHRKEERPEIVVGGRSQDLAVH